MKIRKAIHPEILFIKKHSKQVMKEASVGYLNSNTELAPDLFLENSSYYILLHHDKIIGWVLLGETLDYNRNETIGFISELYVYPNFRKQGCGKALIKHALSILKERRLKHVQLNVFSGNKAKVMYKKMGFLEVYTLMEKTL